jgi:hypothetical protein
MATVQAPRAYDGIESWAGRQKNCIFQLWDEQQLTETLIL